MTTPKVFCFGELLLRMSPVLEGAWIRDAQTSVFIGGAELNVATALARWQVPVMYGTALPENYLTKEILDELEQRGIETSAVHFSGDRLGIYYLPQGRDMKNAGVIYDRAHSSFSELKPGMIDWERSLAGCSWFHLSAIGPALSQSAADVCEEGMRAAKQLGLKVSLDLNHRAKLWKYGKQPVDVMPSLARWADLIMGNIWAAGTLLGIPVREGLGDHTRKEEYLAHARETSQAIFEAWPGCAQVANTFRFDEAGGLRYYASLDTAQQQFVAPEFFTKQAADKVGSGDCFMAGLLYGHVTGKESGDVIGFAASAAFGKLQEIGDTTRQTVGQVEARLAG